MNTQPFIQDRADRGFDDFDLRWALIAAGLLVLCFLSGCADVTAAGPTSLRELTHMTAASVAFPKIVSHAA